MKHESLIVRPGKRISLKSYRPDSTGKYRDKDDAQSKLQRDLERLAQYQDVLYAHDTYSLLIIFQAMDAAGKDSTIKHVMSGVNPQGCQVVSFKQPSREDLAHDYLWRCMKSLPERGKIGIFNRSYYEEVLTVRVHPEILERQRLPASKKPGNIWRERYEDISAFERYLTRNGIAILKFFLHVSKEEQKKRFLERLSDKSKNWKFSPSDVKEREYWNEYMDAYEEMINQTSTRWAPWHIIPSDYKWFTRVVVADIIVEKLKSLKLSYPKLTREQRDAFDRAGAELNHAK